MKSHYDFSKAVVGKYYRPVDQLEMPVYLDPQLLMDLTRLAGSSGQDLTALVNGLLKKDLELIAQATGPRV